ncbi:hypothetical protein D3C81_1261460 [compost metagenome]
MRRVAGAERCKADTGYRVDIGGAGLVQALQCSLQGLGELHRLFVHHAWGEHSELTATAAGNQVFGLRELGTGTLQLYTDRL